MTTYDNSEPLEGWHVPSATFCARLSATTAVTARACQIDAHEPIDCRGEN